MASTSFDTGRQTRVVIQTPFGRLDLPKVVSFEAKPQVDKVRIKPLNAPPTERHLPGGWELSITVNRDGPEAEEWWASVEAGWWTSGSLENCTVYEFTTERSGRETSWAYENTALSLTGAGARKAQEAIEQTIEGFCPQRRKA